MSDKESEIVERAVTALSEHFDSVQIFVTRHDGDSKLTKSIDSGNGNIYARHGQVKEWLVIQDHYTRLAAEKR